MYKEAKTFKELRDRITKDGKTWEQRVRDRPKLHKGSEFPFPAARVNFH